MDNAKRTAIQGLVRQIESYLGEHPEAADTAEGISRWWMKHAASSVERTLVEAALEELVQRGVLVRSALPGGDHVYGQRRPSGGETHGPGRASSTSGSGGGDVK